MHTHASLSTRDARRHISRCLGREASRGKKAKVRNPLNEPDVPAPEWHASRTFRIHYPPAVPAVAVDVDF